MMTIKYTEKQIEYIKNHPAYRYATNAANGRIIVGKRVRKVCQNFLKDISRLEDDDFEYKFDVKLMKKIDKLTKLINIPLDEPKPANEILADFQWFFLINALCWKYKNTGIRRYRRLLLFIARKNGKTFIIALLFLISMILEKKSADYFSVAPDLQLSSILKKEVAKIIEVSNPAIRSEFKITQGIVTCKFNQTKLTPLANSHNRLDGRKAQFWLADEVGALRSSYPISAMRKSSATEPNALGAVISTAYEDMQNPMIEEVDYARRVIDEELDDPTLFALLYEPDEENEWKSIEELAKSNPLYDLTKAIGHDVDTIGAINKLYGSSNPLAKALLSERALALSNSNELLTYKVKTFNTFLANAVSERFVISQVVEDAMTLELEDFRKRKVVLGLDLANIDDYSGFSFVTETDDTVDVAIFGVTNQNVANNNGDKQRFNITKAEEDGDVFIVGDEIHDAYQTIDKIYELASEYDIEIEMIAYDPKFMTNELKQYIYEEYGGKLIPQYQQNEKMQEFVLAFQKDMYSKKIRLAKSDFTRYNFENAQLTKVGSKGYVGLLKPKKNSKIDGVASAINAYRYIKISNEQTASKVETPVVSAKDRLKQKYK